MNSVALVLGGCALAVGSLLHGVLFVLLFSGVVYTGGNLMPKPKHRSGRFFPGSAFSRHAKLAVPAFLVLCVDVALVAVALKHAGA